MQQREGLEGYLCLKQTETHNSSEREGDVRAMLDASMRLCVCVFVFPTRFLICSISPRFFSMHCRFRFRGAEKMHHACRSKVCWILNTAELWGDE